MEAGERMFDKMRRLPDAELEVMKAIWDNTPPMSTNDVMYEGSEQREELEYLDAADTAFPFD